MFKCYTESYELISSKQVPSEKKKKIWLLFDQGMRIKVSSFPALLKDKAPTIINQPMQVRILYPCPAPIENAELPNQISFCVTSFQTHSTNSQLNKLSLEPELREAFALFYIKLSVLNNTEESEVLIYFVQLKERKQGSFKA